jgi:hypothetical protein
MLDDANDTVPSPSNNTLPAPIVAVDDDTDKPDVPENTTLDDAPRTDMVDCADDTEIVDAVSTDKLPDVAAVPTSNLPCGNEMLDEMMLMLPLATLIAPLPVTEIGVLVIDTEAPALLTKITPPFCVTVAPVNETLEPAPPLSIVPPLRLSFVEPVTVNDVVSRNRTNAPLSMLMVLAEPSTTNFDDTVNNVGADAENVTVDDDASEIDDVPAREVVPLPLMVADDACTAIDVAPARVVVVVEPMLKALAPEYAWMPPEVPDKLTAPPEIWIWLPEPVTAASVESAMPKVPPVMVSCDAVASSEISELDCNESAAPLATDTDDDKTEMTPPEIVVLPDENTTDALDATDTTEPENLAVPLAICNLLLLPEIDSAGVAVLLTDNVPLLTSELLPDNDALD